MKIPKAISDLVNQFERLPGIGPKTAQRLTFYLLHAPQPALEDFAAALVNLKKHTVQCSICQNVAESDPCPICSDSSRRQDLVMVVEHPLDVLVIERAAAFDGVYHVLHGILSPLDNIGPDDLYIKELFARLQHGTIREIILGLNPTMEAEATALYLKNKFNELRAASHELKITRLGQGMPTGGDIQYADDSTLRQALEGRKEY
jgi:recombination protein RecR